MAELYRLRTRWQMALRYSGLSPTERAVAWALSTWMSSNGEGCRPAAEDVAEGAGVDRRTVFRAYAELERKGWIRRGGGGGRGRTSTIVPAIPPAADEQLERVLKGGTGDTLSGRKQCHGLQETVTPAVLNSDMARHENGDSLSALTTSPTGASESAPPPWVILGLSRTEYMSRRRRGEAAELDAQELLVRVRKALDEESASHPEASTA